MERIKTLLADLVSQGAAARARKAGIGDERERDLLERLRARDELLRKEIRDHGKTQGERDELRAQLAEVITEKTRLIEELAARDRDYAAQIAEHRRQMEGLAEDPRKREALALYADGDRTGAFPLLEAIVRAENAADSAAAARRNAERLREIAALALHMLDLGEKPLTEVIGLWEDAQREDPRCHWGWVELRRLLQGAGRLADARLAAAHALETAADDRERWVAFDELGDVEAGDLGAARQSFTQGLEIRRRLAAANPDSAQAQRDLIVSCAKLGEMTGEESWWREGLEIAERLHAEGRLAPRDHWMVADLREKAG